MAKGGQAPKESQCDRQVVTFRLDDALYGFDIRQVHEILQMVEITPVPDSPSHVRGAINARGAVLPILDLRMMLGLADKPYGLQTSIVVVGSDEQQVGLPVDEAVDVLDVPGERIEAPTRNYPMSEVLASVCKLDSELLLVFDVTKLVGTADLPELGRNSAGEGQ